MAKVDCLSTRGVQLSDADSTYRDLACSPSTLLVCGDSANGGSVLASIGTLSLELQPLLTSFTEVASRVLRVCQHKDHLFSLGLNEGRLELSELADSVTKHTLYFAQGAALTEPEIWTQLLSACVGLVAVCGFRDLERERERATRAEAFVYFFDPSCVDDERLTLQYTFPATIPGLFVDPQTCILHSMRKGFPHLRDPSVCSVKDSLVFPALEHGILHVRRPKNARVSAFKTDTRDQFLDLRPFGEEMDVVSVAANDNYLFVLVRSAVKGTWVLPFPCHEIVSD